MAATASAPGLANRRLRKNVRYLTNEGRGSLASVLRQQYNVQGLADATAVTFATIIVPNVKVIAGVQIDVMAGLGDGDSSEISAYSIALSRIAGANALIAIGSKDLIAATTGATANTAATLTNVAVAGAVGALNSFALTIAVARSAGSATGHNVLLDCWIFNMLAGGAYFSN